MGNDDVKNKMGNDDHSHISAFLMGFRRVRGLILKRFDISSKVLTSVSQYVTNRKLTPRPGNGLKNVAKISKVSGG